MSGRAPTPPAGPSSGSSYPRATHDPEPPPEPPEPLEFTLGRDHGGHWVVRESHGLCGGLFASRDAAIRFIRAENADRSRFLRVARAPLELDFAS